MKNTDVACGSSNADTSRQYLSCLSALIPGHVLYRCLINIWNWSTHVSKAVQGTLTVNTGAKTRAVSWKLLSILPFYETTEPEQEKERNNYRKQKKKAFFDAKR